MAVGRPTSERFREVERVIDMHYRPEPPELVNVEEAAKLDRPVVREWRGRAYRVDPIPFERGLDLHEALFQYYRPGSVEDTRSALRKMVKLFDNLADPMGLRGKFKWVLRNPFRNASEKEIIALADFFWKLRTGLPFQSWLEKVAEAAESPTVSTTSTPSKERMVDGPQHGRTTAMG